MHVFSHPRERDETTPQPVPMMESEGSRAMTGPTFQPRLAVGAALALAAVASVAAAEGGVRLALAALVGGLAGIALYHAAFGFTAGWRRLIRERRSAAFRAQLLLVGLTTAVAIPLIHYGEAVGVHAGGFVFPFGVAAVVGSFAFGLGMQLGGGCGSGTLFTVGGGSTRMIVTLAFFIGGGLAATFHWGFWMSLPRFDAVGLAGPLGPLGAVAATLAALAAVAAATRASERARHGSTESGPATRSFISGPWSFGAGALALTLVGALTLLVLGRPWGITSGMTLWGAQIAHAAGVPVGEWDYWRNAMGAVTGSPFADGTSVMNFGVIAGACLAAALAGRFGPRWNLSARDLVTAAVGGFLMGYGARLAFGCNIGALLGGIASGSLHGWGWFLFAFAGSVVGVRVRERIGMDPPRPLRSASALGTSS